MGDEKEKERLFDGWAALRRACNASHSGGPGGAAMCVCGAGGGGSSACSMLRTIKELIKYMPTDGMDEPTRERVQRIRECMF